MSSSYENGEEGRVGSQDGSELVDVGGSVRREGGEEEELLELRLDLCRVELYATLFRGHRCELRGGGSGEEVREGRSRGNRGR